MTLVAGTRLGPYEIHSALGAGGMGEVYQARDTKLNRDVALKLLPPSFAQDPERLARFKREAQLLAALNHPHIAAIYGLEETQGTPFLVLELVEGETLAQRLTAGPVSISDALTVARQVADALQAAHDKGIIHRDLKPANIAFTVDGQVKVLDFGLAKATEAATAPAADLTHSPTITTPAMMTGVGMILGTAAYMSPEQAKGREADKRSDVWAFGCVLYEMLTGKRAFAGEDVSDTLASVLARDPDMTALPATVPSAIRTLVQRCLEKDRKQRIADVSTAVFLLTEPTVMMTSVVQPVTAQPARWQRALRWTVAAIALVGVAELLALWAPWRVVSPPTPLRLEAALGSDASLVTDQGAAAVLSPNGSMIAFVAEKGGGRPQLYIRRLDQLQAGPLSGTEGARNPFFSPDGQWIGFFADSKLKKIAVAGGSIVTLCDAPNGWGGTWADDGTIAFVPSAGTSVGRVSASGGTPTSPTTMVEGDFNQRWPQVLPGGNAVLYTTQGALSGFDNANIVVQPLPNGPRKVVQRRGYYGRFLPSGHLVYMHEGTLFAAPFDLDRLELAGQPVPALEGVASNLRTGAQFAVAGNGTLVYLPGQAGQGQSINNEVPVSWMDRQGKTTSLRATPADWSNPAFAPDGRRLALDIFDGKQSDVWVYDWARDALSRLTFDTTDDVKPVWTPDGRRIVFASRQADKGTYNLYWQRADGTGEVQRLTESKNIQAAASWHPSGKFLAFWEINPQTNGDLMILPMEGDEASGWKPGGKPTVFLNSPFSEIEPMFSPDERWIAYRSNESGQNEVYVQPFPGPGGKWQISTSGGTNPTWSRTRHELFYGTTDQRIMVAPYTVEGDSFRAEKPRLWSEGRYFSRLARPASLRSFDLHPDGERFALAVASAAPIEEKRDKLVFLFNFFDELRRIAPATKR